MPTKKKAPVKRQRSEKTKTILTSRIRSVGNSKGVILNNTLLKVAGFNANVDIAIEASAGLITIAPVKASVNTDLSSWDKQFKKSIKAGAKPEKDLFEGLVNEFDKTEW